MTMLVIGSIFLVIGLSMFVFGFLQYTKAIASLAILQKEFEKILEREIKNAHTSGSVSYRFKEVTRITKEQLDLVSQGEMPMKGALHSKNRANISNRLKELEEAKRAIFQTFLDDKLDPIVKVMDPDGKTKNVKISELLKDDTTNPTPTDSKPVRKNPLTLVTETNEDGKDSTDKPKDPTLH